MSPCRTPYRTPPLFDDIEDVQKYIVGGFHPVDIGDWLYDYQGNGAARYQVIRKLGSGGFATVWWTRSSLDQRYYAVKVMCHNASDDRELATMRQLSNLGVSHAHVVALLNSFRVIGPNGSHLCLVYPVLGPSVIQAWPHLPAPLRNRICVQMASGLAFLHKYGICHGDLTTANVLFELRDVNTWSETQISDLFGPPKTANLRLHNGLRSEHGPDQVSQALRFPINEAMLGDIRIIDFGQSFNADKPPSGLGIPMPYYPPELCFGYAPSRATDVWALACCIFEVQTQRLLVSPVFDSFEFFLGTLRYTLGTLPLEWKTRYSDDCASADFKGQGPLPNWFDEPEFLEWPLASLVDEGASHLSPAGKDQLLSLLRAMLEYEPSQRLQAEDVLNHPWIRVMATDGASSMPATG